MFKIYCQSGVAAGRQITIAGSTTVGRESTCDIVLDDPKVSRLHGTFKINNDHLFFLDNGSTNGTFANGKKVLETEIVLGDVLKIGSSEFMIAEESDFRTIHFVQSESTVTGIVNATSVKADALADKFAAIFDFYKEKENAPEISDAEQFELVRTQRLLNGLKTIFKMSQTLSKLVPLNELLPQICASLFDVFAGAENIVVLLHNEQKKTFQPVFAAARDSDEEPTVNISQTVLDRAINERCTLIANDTLSDERFAHSESIIGFSVKAVICAPLVSGDNTLGALYLDNRVESINYDDLDGELISVFANNCAVAIDNAKLCDTLQEHYSQTLQSFINAIEAKDPYTKGHTQRVSKYSVGIAEQFEFPAKHLDRIRIAADLHDIGKIGIKEGVINKPGKLTDTEYASIKDHVVMGEKILKPITSLAEMLPWIRGHHERWDGSGYPDGLKAEECTLEGRIIGVADVFDAMTSQRSYNQPLTFVEAKDKIKSLAGKLFDPLVVEKFEQYVDKKLIPEEVLAGQGAALGVE